MKNEWETQQWKPKTLRQWQYINIDWTRNNNQMIGLELRHEMTHFGLSSILHAILI